MVTKVVSSTLCIQLARLWFLSKFTIQVLEVLRLL